MSSPLPARTVILSFNLAEKMLADILNVVPYCSAHHGVWSPLLATVILETCSQLDSLWKSQYSPGPNRDIVQHFQRFGADVGKRWLVFWGEEGERLQPFASWDVRPTYTEDDYQRLPWWKAYNDLKHDRLANREQATLKSAVEAMAGLFVAIVRTPGCSDSVAKEGWIPPPDQYGQSPADILGEGALVVNLAAESKLFSYPVHAFRKAGPSIQSNMRSYRLAHWCEENNVRSW